MLTLIWSLVPIVVAFLMATPARAAEIDYKTGKANIIVVQGEIASGDAEKFARIVPDLGKKTAVLLSSPGGNVVAALAIGEIIHKNGYVTIVPDEQVCASACGLIWLGGATRMVSETARVGFHAAYVGDGPTKLESGVGNAMIGAYLARIGLSYKAVEFLTSAPPTDMQWLHPGEARSVGIDFVTVPAERPSEAWSSPLQIRPSVPHETAPAAPPAMTPTALPAEERARSMVLSWYAQWSSMGTDTSSLRQYYGDTVRYYGGTTPRTKVLLEKEKFAVRWPVRNYKVRQDSLIAKCLTTCWITGIVDWNVSSPVRGERSIGSANFAMEIPTNGPFFVLSETGSVLTSHKEPLAPPENVATLSAAPARPSARFDITKPGTHDYLYPHERLATPPYKNAYAALFVGQEQPLWLRRYHSTLDGVEMPVWWTRFRSEMYQGFEVCQPHACNIAWIDVLLSPNGGQAWALTWADGKPDQWWGKPDEETQQLLLGLNHAPLPSTTVSPEPRAILVSPAYADGRQARLDYERWIVSFTDSDYKDGALFWAANRSNKPPPSCKAVATSDRWYLGCTAAQAKLRPIDARRKAERDFKIGWNSL